MKQILLAGLSDVAEPGKIVGPRCMPQIERRTPRCRDGAENSETTSMGETPLDHKQIVAARKVKKITSHFHVFFFRSDAGWKSSLSQPPHHINLRGDPPLRQLVILVASLQVCPSKAETARKGPNKTQQKLL